MARKGSTNDSFPTTFLDLQDTVRGLHPKANPRGQYL
jgi:hypothetical protein